MIWKVEMVHSDQLAKILKRVLPVNTLTVIDNFETKFSNKINGPLELLSPSLINLDNIPIRLSNDSDKSVNELADLLDCDTPLISKRKRFITVM
jgi:hypothetical protein